MYGWIWDLLPGNRFFKAIQFTLLMAGALALLWFKIFPWAEPLLPFDDVTVGTGGPAEGGGP